MSHPTPILLAVVLSTTAAQAEAPPSLRPLAAEALAANPQLRADFETLRGAIAVGDEAGALPNPELTYTEFVTGVETRTGPQERAVGVRQSIPWPGVLKLRRSVADGAAEVARFRYQASRREVLAEVGEAYFNFAFLHMAYGIAEDNLGLLEQLAPVVDDRARAGAGAGLASTLRLDIERGRASDRIASIERGLPVAAANLGAVLGREPGNSEFSPALLPDAPPSLGEAEDLRPLLDGHPLLVAAQSGIDAASLGVDLASLAARPKFMLGANLIDIGDGGESAVGVSVGLSIPLWREKNRSVREQAAARLAASEAAAEAVERTLSAAFEARYQAYLDARDRVALYSDQLLPAAEQAISLTEQAYRTGAASLTDLIDTERTLLDLRLARARALADAHKAAWQTQVLTGPDQSEPSPSK